MKNPQNTETGRLADQLERAVHGGAWHGLAVLEALDGVDAAGAGRRTGLSPHTIAGLVRHITFWMDSVCRRITGTPDVDPGDDWAEQGALTDADWAQTVADLEETHTKLRAALVDLEDGRLDDTAPGADSTVRGLVLGTLQHIAYHTGQIVQLNREKAK